MMAFSMPLTVVKCLTIVNRMDLMGAQDIADLLGCTRQRAHQLIAREGFPQPVHTINARTKVWDRDQVVDWAVRHRYDITPPPKP